MPQAQPELKKVFTLPLPPFCQVDLLRTNNAPVAIVHGEAALRPTQWQPQSHWYTERI